MKASADIPISGTEGGNKAKRNFGHRATSTGGTAIPRQPKFEGFSDAPDLKGHIYDCSDSRQADLYIRTTSAIAEHVGRKYRYGGDVRLAIMTLELPTMALPPDLEPTASQAQKRIWEKKVDDMARRETWLDENLSSLYSLIWGQCSDTKTHKQYQRKKKMNWMNM